MRLTVVGVSGVAALTECARAAVRDADLLIGSAVNISQAVALAGASGAVERIELGPLTPALQQLEALASPCRPVVLASGDPGLFGILRALRAAGHECEVIPSVSSVAAAYAAVGLPWDDAVVVSAHGRELAPAVNACRAFGNVAVLTAPGSGPLEIARGLDGWPRELVVAERLGRADQRITWAAAADVARLQVDSFAEPNVVLSLDPTGMRTTGMRTSGMRTTGMRSDNQPAAAPEEGWAWPESSYAHRDSMITKSEVRALAVARLRPRLGRLILDVGAGSGSVGIECNLLGAAVIAIECDPGACRTIAANAAAHSARIRIVEQSVPDALEQLPAADAAFVGGGGTVAVKSVIDQGIPTVVAAFAAVDRAIAAHQIMRAAGYRVDGVQLSAARLADLPGGSLRLAATNPVLVLTGERA